MTLLSRFLYWIIILLITVFSFACNPESHHTNHPAQLEEIENRLWVSTIVGGFDIYEWWVLEESGELITKFTWPRDEPIEVVKNGKMYTRESDEETGLQQVVRYRVEMEEG